MDGYRIVYISIHALLAESDVAKSYLLSVVVYFYPRSPCGERLNFHVMDSAVITISIHALLAESDDTGKQMEVHTMKFLSTLSLRRATPSLYQLYDTYAFLSTLSLRRATRGWTLNINGPMNFYPRSPCGERRETMPRGRHIYKTYFYPRSPCGERQFRKLLYPGTTRNFYPRSPCGERPK